MAAGKGGVNHLVPSGLAEALITGGEVWSLCMTKFAPTLRVGSSGKADQPGWPVCPDCTEAKRLLRQRAVIREERRRLNKEMRDLYRQVEEIWGRDTTVAPREAPAVTPALAREGGS